MKNVIFISPNFPTNYWQFCRELNRNGMNVLGIGDQPYDELNPELKNSLTEYYKVDTLEDDEAVYRAVAFFIFKYGRIDWLESNNEYWLERDARLRTDFHITSGFQEEDIPRVKYKSGMKKYYEAAGIPTARYHLADDLQGCLAFVEKVGYPIIAKPDNGMGASHTFKIENEEQMKSFYGQRMPDTPYILEEFIDAEINSYDAIIDAGGTPIFETGNVTLVSIMETVNEEGNAYYYIRRTLPKDIRTAGRAAVKSFDVKSRFIHFEFFRLRRDHEGLGKKGDVVALEVNMRPSGGFTTDMINFAHSTNVYKIWADMVAFGHSEVPVSHEYYCAFAGLRDGRNFALSHEDILQKYADNIRMSGRIPDALADAMGNRMYIAVFTSKKDMDGFFRDLDKRG